MKFFLRILSLFLLQFSMVQIKVAAQSPDSWTQKADFGGSGRTLAVGFSIGKKGYIGTGRTETSTLSDFWEYDPQSDTWSQKADYGGGARFGAYGFSIGNKGYIGGGAPNPTSASYSFWEYDVEANQWTQKADAIRAVFGAVGVTVEGKGYVYSGAGTAYNLPFSTGGLDRIESGTLMMYDVATNTWTFRTTQPTSDWRVGPIGFSLNGKLYVGGGNRQNGTPIKTFFEYNPSSDSWTAKADLPGNSFLSPAFVLGNKGYVGLAGNKGSANELYEYNPTTNSWASKATYPPGNRDGGAGFSVANKGYIGTGSSSKSFYQYTPSESLTPATALKFDPSLTPNDNSRLNYVSVNNPFRAFQKEMTVEFWMYVPNANLPFGSLMGQGTSNVDNNWVWLMHPEDNGTMSFYVNDGGTLRSTNCSITAGAWHHYAATTSATSTKFYIDGILVHTGAGVSGNILSNPSSVIHIGKDVRYATRNIANGDPWNRYATMTLDEVRIWSRALCEDEIRHNKNVEINPAVQTGLQHYYNFNQGFVNANNPGESILYDLSGNNRNGVLNNFTLYGTSSNWVASGFTSTGTYTLYDNSPAPITGLSNICIGASTTLSNAKAGGKWFSNNPGVATINELTGQVSSISAGVTSITYVRSCGAVSAMDLVVNPIPTTSITGTNTICSGSTTTLTASGSTGTTYLWNTGATTASITVSPTATTTYSVTATNAGGCTAQASRTVTVNAVPTASVSGTNTICSGGSTILIAGGGGGGATYLWNTGATTFAITVSPSVTTTYTVTITNNGCSAQASRTVTVNALPTPAVSGTNTICSGNSTTLTATGGTSYSWNTGATTASIDVSPTATTTYTVTATNAAGCTAQASRTVTANAKPTVGIFGDLNICSGEATNLFATGGTGNTFLWSTGATSASINVSPTVTTTYTLTATNAVGCTAQASRTVTVNALPVVTASSNSPISPGNNLQLSANGATTYSWSGPNGFSSSLQNPIINSPTSAASGTYTVTGTNANGCTNTASVNVTMLSTPATALKTDGVDDHVTISNPFRSFGKAITVEFWMNSPTGKLAQGSVMGQSSLNVDGMTTNVWLMHPDIGGTNIDFYVNDAGTWRSVTVPIRVGGWHHYVGVASEFGTKFYVDGVLEQTGPGISTGILNNANSILQIGKDPRHTNLRFADMYIDEVRIWSRALCEDEITNNKDCELNPAGQNSLQEYYRFNQGFVGANNSTETSLTDLSGNNRHGTLSGFALTGNNSNWVESGFVSTANCSPYIAPVSPITGNTSLCIGSNTTLVNATTGGLWSSSNTAIATINANTGVVNALSAGTTTITYRTECGGVSTATLTVNALPVATISGTNTICLGGSTVLTASGGATYLWNTGATTASITVSPTVTTTYTVTVTSAAGCSAQTSRAVTVNALPTAAVSGTNNICAGGSTTLTATGGIIYLWNTGATSAAITVSPSVTTTYTVTATNAAGCTAQASGTVTVNAIPVVTASSNSPVAVGNNLQLSANGAVNYSWSGPNGFTSSMQNPVINNVTTAANGTYTVTATNASGCTNTATVNVTVLSDPATALHTDGVDDYVTINNPFRTFGKELTVEFWMNTPNAIMPYGSVMGQATAGVDNMSTNVWLMHPNTTGGIDFLVNDAGTWRGVTVPIKAGGWHHYVGVSSEFGTKFYVDGVLEATGPAVTTGIVNNANSVIHIGKDVRHNTGRFGNITVDEVRIWNRVLCEGEINNSMNCELNPSGLTGLQQYYRFNQGYIGANNSLVTTLVDASGNGRDGQLNNFALTGANSNWVASGSTNTGTCTSFSPPTAPITGLTYICIGSTATLSNSIAGGLWSSSNPGVATINANTGLVTSVSGGLTTITYKNECGGISTTTVTIAALLAPTITPPTGGTNVCPGNTVTLNAPAGFGLVYQWYKDGVAISGATSATYTATVSGTYTAARTSGSCSSPLSNAITVTIQDVTKPTITCSNNISVGNDPGRCGAIVAITPPIATDNCSSVSLTGVRTDGKGLSEEYPVGTTGITWTAKDASNNTNICTQVVTVFDQEPPSISCQANISTIATSAAGAVINYNTPIGSDNCGVGSTVRTEGLASGSTFPIGTTTVTYRVTDAIGGLSTQCSFTVTVVGVPPVITCPANITMNAAAGTCAANVNFTATETEGIPASSIAYTINGNPVVSGASFPVGTTTVVATATNAVGSSSCSFTVTVVDNQNPIITAPASVQGNNTPGLCTGTVTLGTPVTADNCGVASVDNDAPSLFPVGTTIVTWTVTDIHGNTATATQTVVIADNEKPTITAPANVQGNNTAGLCTGTVILGTPVTADNCGVASVENDAPATFPVGSTTVTWTVTDIHGNSTTATQTVVIADNEKPTITAPANIQGNNTAGLCTGTVILGTPVTADNCGVASVENDAPATFPVGSTIVTWTVTDIHGNTATATQTVVITDNEKPTITAPANVQGNNTAGLCTGTVILGTPVTADNCGVASVENDAPATFPVGSTTVTWTVTDIHGNSATATQTVVIVDNEKPSITAPTNVQGNNTAGLCSGTVILGIPETGDNCGVASVTNDAPSTGIFPVGTTTVTWTVTDIHGNTATATQTVVIVDNEKPTISTSNITVNNDLAKCAATIEISLPTTNDNCAVLSVQGVRSDNVLLTADYPVGTTTITWTVRDIHGNTNSVLQTIVVTDNEKPVISCAANQVFCTNTGGNTHYVIPVLNQSDNCDIASTTYSVTGVTNRSGSGTNASGIFAIGTSTVTYTVTDIHGNVSTCSFTVTINPLPVAGINVQSPDVLCNQFTLTGTSTLNGPFGYQWLYNNSPKASTLQLSLGLADADGVYTLFVTDGNGCRSEMGATYNYQKQNLSSSYTLLAKKDVKLGHYNTVESGSVGVMTTKGEADFKKYTSVNGTGSFVKAPKIDADKGSIINSKIYGVATVTLPTMQYNTSSTRYLRDISVNQNTTVTLTGNYDEVTIKKGANATLTGTIFGKVRLEEGASVKFTSAVVDMEELQIDRGPKSGGYSYVRFTQSTSVRVNGKVSIGNDVIVNPDAYAVTFYIGDKCDDGENFHVKGDDTRITANIYIPNGKIKVTGGNYGGYSSHGKFGYGDDDDRDSCDHRSHSYKDCKHKGHGHHDCDHRNHHERDCRDYVYMTGLFIAEEIHSEGKYVIWNGAGCSASLTPTTAVTSSSNTTIATDETVKTNALKVVTSDEDLKVTVMPNPSTTYFTLKLESKYDAPVNMRVVDMSGRVVDTRAKLGSNATVQVGHNYQSGTYFAEFTQGNRRKVVQLMKIR